MKKFMSIILSLVVLLTLCSCAFIPKVSAAKNDEWVLAPYAEYITHNGKIYKNIFSPYYETWNFNKNYSYYSLDFADDKTAENYEDSNIDVFDDVVIGATINSALNGYQQRIYVEESHLQEFEDVMQGIGNEYVFYDVYGNDTFSFSPDDLAQWLKGDVVTFESDSLGHYERVDVFARDASGVVEVGCAQIVYDYFTDQLYLVNYRDYEVYDRDYFDNNGFFYPLSGKEISLYTLEDETLKSEIFDFINSEPEDDLDWLFADDSDDSEGIGEVLAVVFCSFFFGVLPLAAFGFSVVMLFVVKDKKYIRPYAVVTIGSVLVLAAFIFVLLILV